MWKQCFEEHTKAPFLDTKAPKITRNYTKNLCRTLRDAKVVGSNPVASTKKCRKLLKFPAFFIAYFLKNFQFPFLCLLHIKICVAKIINSFFFKSIILEDGFKEIIANYAYRLNNELEHLSFAKLIRTKFR